MVEVRPQTDIYLESLSPGECFKCLYDHTPLCIKECKKYIYGTFVRKMNRATGTKVGIHTKTFDPGINMGSVSHATPLTLCELA